MTPQQVDELAAQMAATAELARRLGQDFTPEELSTAPAAGGWSAADNLAHLTLSSKAFVPRMTKTLGKLRDADRRSDRPSRPDWVGRLYAWALEPPVRFRVKAPKPFAPPVGTPVSDALPAFLAEQEHVQALVEQSRGFDLASLKVPTPISRHLRYNVYSAFLTLVAHQRRHMWQARRAAENVRAREGS